MQRLADLEAERTRLLGEQGVLRWGNFAGRASAAGAVAALFGRRWTPCAAYKVTWACTSTQRPSMQWGSGALQSTPAPTKGTKAG